MPSSPAGATSPEPSLADQLAMLRAQAENVEAQLEAEQAAKAKAAPLSFLSFFPNKRPHDGMEVLNDGASLADGTAGMEIDLADDIPFRVSDHFWPKPALKKQKLLGEALHQAEKAAKIRKLGSNVKVKINEHFKPRFETDTELARKKSFQQLEMEVGYKKLEMFKVLYDHADNFDLEGESPSPVQLQFKAKAQPAGSKVSKAAKSSS
jgi:hypothetical protein